MATASPGFVQQWFDEGVTAMTLARAPCLTFNAKDGLQRAWIAQATGAKLSPPTHYLPSTHAFIDAARAGMGWGMNPESLVRGPIRNGRLVDERALLDVPLTWQVARVMSSALAPVTQAVRRAAAKGLVAAG